MPQQVIVIPALGIVEFRNTVSKVIEEFNVEQYKEEEEVNEEDLPISSAIGSRRTKIFYMDVGKNNRGIYCRMTEQSANFRQSLRRAPLLILSKIQNYLERLNFRGHPSQPSPTATSARSASGS